MKNNLFKRVEGVSFEVFWYDLNAASGKSSRDMLAEMLELREGYDRVIGRDISDLNGEERKRKEYLEGQDARYKYVGLMLAKRYETELERYFESLSGLMRGDGEGI